MKQQSSVQIYINIDTVCALVIVPHSELIDSSNIERQTNNRKSTIPKLTIVILQTQVMYLMYRHEMQIMQSEDGFVSNTKSFQATQQLSF